MARIAIVKLRTAHDVELEVGWVPRQLLRLAGANTIISRLHEYRGRPALPQMTLPYLAALVADYGARSGHRHHCILVDEPEERVRQVLSRNGPYSMVWLTSNTPAAPGTYRLAAELKGTGCPTVLGGIHPSVFPEEAGVYADSVVCGEAETVVDQVLSDFDRDGRLSPIYRGGRTPSLAGLPSPAWEQMGYEPLVLCVQTSRGCRNACAFCSTTRFQGTRRRHRPVADIVAELRRHLDRDLLNCGTVFFTDNNIVSDTDHRRSVVDTSYARELFEALIPLGIPWAGQGEINLADDPELCELAAASGCHTLLVGFESIDQQNLGDVHKPSNDVERYAEQIEVLRRHGIALIGCFIFGLDHDTPEIFERTHDFIAEHIDIPQVSIMTPFPGTALFKRLEREGRILSRDWSRYDILQVVHRPARMTVTELEQGFRDLNRRLFSPAQLMRRAYRFASSPRVPRFSHEPRAERFGRVLGPNLYYRALAQRVLTQPGLPATAAARVPIPSATDLHIHASA